jgi:penicillin-binding protein 1A
MFANFQAHHVVQGGSTLTQQLAKNLYFLGDHRTMTLKLREALCAMRIEQRYSKDQILETYLNNVYFGSGTYGVEQASERYFGKSASKLSLAESAYLAGLVNAPSKLSEDKVDALARQHMVLESMAHQGMISETAAAQAEKTKLVVHERQTDAERCGYYFACVQSALEQNHKADELYKNGVRAYTYLDVTAQSLAREAITNGIRHAPRGVSQGALVSISVKDGGVIAMVGGAGTYEQSPWNRATSAHTAGSAFKPFVYLAGLIDHVIQPDTMLEDAPLSVQVPGTSQVYAPKNFDGKYMGPITVRKALALSRNTCAVRVGMAVGPQRVAAVARQSGITSNLDATLSLSLGASAVSPLEMAGAYATLARGGVFIRPSLIRKIATYDGKVVEENQPQAIKVFDPEPVAELVDALQDVVERGTGSHARLFDRPVAGKTGTADGARDIWFIGFTPDISTAVWGGNDRNMPIAGKQVTGGTIMAGIWQNYMHAYYAKCPTPPGSFAPPQFPLIVEPEPIHFIPQPADIFGQVGQYADPYGVPVAPQRSGEGDAVPPLAPQRHMRGAPDEENTPVKKKKGGIKGFFKKLFDSF